MSSARNDTSEAIENIIAAAGIEDHKRGAKRHARLTPLERALYFWILRRFAAAGRPVAAEMRVAARHLGIDLERSLGSLAREDLVHVDSTGSITVAYPFSGVPTRHRVRFPNGAEVHTMCALDALGIAPMFDTAIDLVSSDPLTRQEIRVQMEPRGHPDVYPGSAALVAGTRGASGASYAGCCPVLNLFASPPSARRWLREHPDVHGRIATMAEAVAAGRAIFGEVFTRTNAARPTG